MNENKTFVRTSDSETAERLKMENFTLVSKDNGFYTFLNSGMMKFSDEEKKNIVYTNILNI